jgi:transposase
MREGLFWLDDLQRGFLPGRKRRGPRRVDDRRVIRGIIHVLQSGMRCRDCPKEYGPSTTIYNRWHRWSQKGLWQRLFNELIQIVGTHYENAIDSTTIKVHRSARGKKGPRPGPGHKPRRLHNQSPRGDRPQRPPFALSPERRPMLRWQSRRAFAEAFAPAQETVG